MAMILNFLYHIEVGNLSNKIVCYSNIESLYVNKQSFPLAISHKQFVANELNHVNIDITPEENKGTLARGSLSQFSKIMVFPS